MLVVTGTPKSQHGGLVECIVLFLNRKMCICASSLYYFDYCSDMSTKEVLVYSYMQTLQVKNKVCVYVLDSQRYR
jgi:hypothetical protein